MRGLALWLAFFGVAVSSIADLLYTYGVPDVLPYPHLSFCLPALIFGLIDLAENGRRIISPLVACLALAGLSLFWVEPTEQGRGLLIFAGIATSFPLAAVIVKARAYRLCAQAFVLGSLVVLFAALSQYTPGSRLGHFAIAGQGLVLNANAFAIQMVAAVVLSASFFLVDRDPSRYGTPALSLNAAHTTLIIAMLVMGTLLAASRGALFCLLVVSLLLLCQAGTGRARVHAVFLLMLVVMALGPFASVVVEPAASRLADKENLQSLGSRLDIWVAAWDARMEAGFWGTGVGGVEKRLAEYLPDDEEGRLGLDGVTRKASHNSYVEWCLSLGAPGLLTGLWLLASVCTRAVRIDRSEVSINRKAILLFCLICSVSSTVYRLPYWTPIGAILLAALAKPVNTPNTDAIASDRQRAIGPTTPIRRPATRRPRLSPQPIV